MGLDDNCDGSSIITLFAGLNCSAENLVNKIPTPSIRASSTPPMIAEPTMAPAPLRTESTAPVRAPLVIEFQGSSFFLI